MNKSKIILSALIAAATLSGCSGMSPGGLDLGNAIGAGSDLYKAANVSDAELQSLGVQSAKELDTTNKVAPAGSKYAQRLSKITSKFKNEEGLKLEFKAYLVDDVNAFALPNGSVRVYSGLMDKMTDDELRFVIGHEIGHVKNGHAKEKMRLAYAASAARKGVASSNTVAGSVAASELGGLVEAVINSQFSQSEEEESDDFGLALLKKHGYPSAAAVSALNKLDDGSGKHSFLSSHPAPKDRAARIAKKG